MKTTRRNFVKGLALSMASFSLFLGQHDDVEKIRSTQNKKERCLDCGKRIEIIGGFATNCYGRATLGEGFVGFVCNKCHNKRFVF